VRILSVVHGPLVRAELFEDVVREEGHELVEWEIVARGRPPANGYDAVMVFGGDMNVGEELEHPWLHDEYEALRAWVADGTPLFGVCLAAQTLAHALGGRVGPLPAQLGGFYDSELTPAGRADPVLGVLPPRFEALNANAYAYELPADGSVVELARGPVPQAFRAGEAAWAVQFHPEVRGEQILAWLREDEPRLTRPLAEAVAEIEAGLPAWQELGRRLCRAFLATAARV
jgi:GMP synthase-like glutamine amidotransferase